MCLRWLPGLLMFLVGCVSDSSSSYVGGREPEADARAGTSLLVRCGPKEDMPGAWAVFLPMELNGPGFEGWSTKTLRAAGYCIDVIETEDTVETAQVPEPASGTDALMVRRPPRRGGPGRTGARQPPLLNPRPTPQERMETQRRAAELAAVQAARKLYAQRLEEAKALYPNSQGYQDHHLIPVYLGGPKTGVTYRIPTAYHKLITQAFRRAWSYDRPPPNAMERQELLLKVYSQYPIPQLIGLMP